MVAFIEPESIRRRTGLSKTQWAELVRGQNEDQRAYEISRLFERFLAHVHRALDNEFKNPEYEVDGVPCLSTIQAARALGIGEFHLANLRDRGKLKGRKFGRRAAFARVDLDAFLSIPQAPQERQSAMAQAFLRWCADNDYPKRFEQAKPKAPAYI